jgi:hypothetical protein
MLSRPGPIEARALPESLSLGDAYCTPSETFADGTELYDAVCKQPDYRLPAKRSVACSGMGLLRRLSTWWNKDALERAEEETRMTESERDAAEEDYEARKDDVAVRGGPLGRGDADYERDSEPPRP